MATALLMLLLGAHAAAGPVNDEGQAVLDYIPRAKFQFDGMLGQRVKADVENWLLVTPEKNPGLLDMFANRESNVERDLGVPASWNDSKNLVPWAGEYVGKYLISAVQALRMSDDPRLRETTSRVVERLIQLQAEDGYLGPWPKKEQLLGHWDLWGNYHVMFGLILWYEQTGDEKALAAARKAADLVCNTYLDADRRVYQAGAEEMNMGIIHGLAILYRKTGEPRYLRMAKEVLRDFERGGDYYRLGLQSVEYYRTPKPRWESLHSLQGMAELYYITGDETFRQSFLHHWASIRRFDLRNTGGFSSGEQATGDPFTDSPVETCCVIAWQAVMIDALRLTGDSTIADDLELATFNAVAGAQHPSGEWWTYDAAMNQSQRMPFHVQHAWQSRPNAPFLGCCPVNGPRGLGMLSEWGVMRSGDGLTINYYGPMKAEVALPDGAPVSIGQNTDYPIGNSVQLNISPVTAKQFTLALRIPAWSKKTEVLVNGQAAADVKPGEYLKLNRMWKPGDGIAIQLDMDLRYESGDLEQAGRIAIYRGPILLCADDRFKTSDSASVDAAKRSEAKLAAVDASVKEVAGPHAPWLVVDVPTVDGKTLRLIDFANAGATGKGYRSWLPAQSIKPAQPVASLPRDRAKIGPGAVSFVWRVSSADQGGVCYRTIVISDSPSFDATILSYRSDKANCAVLPAEEAKKLQPGKPYYWKILSKNAYGESESIGPFKQFTIDPNAAPMDVFQRREDGVLTAASLHGDVKPEYGRLAEARGRPMTSQDFALGGNPTLPSGSECLAVRISDFRLLDEALSVEEIRRIFEAEPVHK